MKKPIRTQAIRIIRDEERFTKIVADATDAFWKSVAASVPEAKTGDLSPLTVALLDDTARAVVYHWIMENVVQP